MIILIKHQYRIAFRDYFEKHLKTNLNAKRLTLIIVKTRNSKFQLSIFPFFQH